MDREKHKRFYQFTGLKTLPLVGVGLLLGLGFVLLVGQSAEAEGFQINRYEPTPAGEWSFMVDHPWYSRSGPMSRYFSGGITLDYAHNPLVFGQTDANGNFFVNSYVIEHLLMGHVDLSGSFANRVNIHFSLPITLLQRGSLVDAALAGVTLTETAAVGDPRLGITLRLFGNPYKDAISMHLGAYVWFPLANYAGTFENQERESGWRVMPQIILSGLKNRVSWSLVGRFYYRPDAQIGYTNLADNRAGMEVQAGLAIAYADVSRRFSIGAEALASAMVTNIPDGMFYPGTTSVELLPLTINFNIANQVNVGLAGGLGLLRQPGTPDGRAILRLAYAPMPKPDRDQDGVIDEKDVCPDEAKGVNPDPERLGCPLRDRDKDGIWDKDDACPDQPGIKSKDPKKHGCPDRDQDGFIDQDDECPDMAAGPNPDEAHSGCPLKDRDQDGVWDKDDACPDEAKGVNPDPERLGCPLRDRDQDGVWDKDDVCPDEPAGVNPDPGRPGCPKKETSAVLEKRQIRILDKIYFATNKSVIKPPFHVLYDVMRILQRNPQVTNVRIEAYADYRGTKAFNKKLSINRAKAVFEFLTKDQFDPTTNQALQAIDPSRLTFTGCGRIERKPQGKTNVDGIQEDRRVQFIIEGEECASLKEETSAKETSVP